MWVVEISRHYRKVMEVEFQSREKAQEFATWIRCAMGCAIDIYEREEQDENESRG